MTGASSENPPLEQPTPSATGGTPVIVANGKPAPAPRVPIFSAEAWSPLKVQLFRSLYIATSIAQIGTWVREAGGPWLMKILTDGRPETPVMVANVLLFSSLPICLFSVFAGALADVLDRRRLLIFTQAWMLIVSVVLGVLTIANYISPWGLLGLTFLVGTGTALAGPALQALLPELVPKKDLALAINLNSVALNVARALGPAMFILVVAVVPGRVGVGISFFLTAVSFIWAIWVLFAWKRPSQRAAVHGEEMWNAIRAGYQYTVHSKANRAILLRVLTFIVPAVVMWSQVPIIASQLLGLQTEAAKEKGSALLFAFVGIGAIVGVLLMPGLHKRFKIDPVVNVCTGCFAAGLITLSRVHSLWQAMPVMVFLGVNWVIIPTNFNTATQKSVPLWVKGRAISFYLTVLFGSFVIGSKIWGPLTKLCTSPAHPAGVSISLLVGGITMAACLVLAKWFPLTLNEGLNLTSAFTGPPPKPVLPDIVAPADSVGGPLPMATLAPTAEALASAAEVTTPVPVMLKGPVLVTLHYHVDPTRVQEFLGIMKDVGQQRRRNGASTWQLEAGATEPGGLVTYREIIRYRSTGEHARQPARMTMHDVALLAKARAFHTGSDELPGRSEILTGDAANPYAPLKNWAKRKMWESFDRFFDETAGVFDRYAGMCERERKSRIVTYREVRIRIPE